jgi:aminopeptidase N
MPYRVDVQSTDTFTTRSGKQVQLGIYSKPHTQVCDADDDAHTSAASASASVEKFQHALQSLKQAMLWDEEVFGLECDLDTYNVVAVDDFNMGAMENKGLNIFNSAYVLADAASATDADFGRVLSVIGHEYFHNWTGNR